MTDVLTVFIQNVAIFFLKLKHTKVEIQIHTYIYKHKYFDNSTIFQVFYLTQYREHLTLL